MGAGTAAATGICVCLGLLLLIAIAVGVTGISIAQIVIGAMNLKECPREYLIPIYLIVAGVTGFGVSFVSGSAGYTVKKQKDNDVEYTGVDGLKKSVAGGNRCLSCFQSLLGLFALAWFIFGNVIVFRSRGDYVGEPTNFTLSANSTDINKYCKPLVMEFAFGTIMLSYALLGISIVAACLGCFIMCCCAAAASGST